MPYHSHFVCKTFICQIDDFIKIYTYLHILVIKLTGLWLHQYFLFVSPIGSKLLIRILNGAQSSEKMNPLLEIEGSSIGI
jgi:hypothetical protein